MTYGLAVIGTKTFLELTDPNSGAERTFDP
jgi:hypothetical protein